MASSLVTSHPTQRNEISDDLLDVPEPEAATFLPADIKNAEELKFDETEVIAFFKTKNYKVHMCVRITSNVSIPTVSVFKPGTGLSLVCTSFLPVECHDHLHSIHNMSLNSVQNNPVNLISKIMLFIQLADLHTCAHFGLVHNLVVPLLIGISFIDRYVKGVFPFERCIVPIQSRQAHFFQNIRRRQTPCLYFRTASTLRPLLTSDRRIRQRHSSFPVKKCAAISPSTEASVSVMNSSAGIICMGPTRF